jgi:hypothetical protein
LDTGNILILIAKILTTPNLFSNKWRRYAQEANNKACFFIISHLFINILYMML